MNTERLQKYEYDDYTVVVNFETFEDAQAYQAEHGGEMMEVGFIDGSDNPMPNDTAGLIAKRRTFAVGLPAEYSVIYSDDEKFQEYADHLLAEMKKAENDVLPEDIASDQNIAPGDKIIVMKNGELNTVTTRERIKFLMQGNVYELAIKVMK